MNVLQDSDGWVNVSDGEPDEEDVEVSGLEETIEAEQDPEEDESEAESEDAGEDSGREEGEDGEEEEDEEEEDADGGVEDAEEGSVVRTPQRSRQSSVSSKMVSCWKQRQLLLLTRYFSRHYNHGETGLDFKLLICKH